MHTVNERNPTEDLFTLPLLVRCFEFGKDVLDSVLAKIAEYEFRHEKAYQKLIEETLERDPDFFIRVVQSSCCLCLGDDNKHVSWHA